jgi:hypothetical protein
MAYRANNRPGRTVRIKKIRSLLSSFTISLYLKGKTLTDARTLPTLGEGRNMDKDFRPILRWCDKAEATIIIPFGEFTFNTHNKRSIEKLIYFA